jgi:hypothetical protein
MQTGPDLIRLVCLLSVAGSASFLRGFARYDMAFAASMTVLLMSLAVYSAGPGARVLLGAAGLGVVVAVVKVRRRRA